MRKNLYLLSLSMSLIAAISVGCSPSAEPVTETSTVEPVTQVEQVEFANTKCPIMGGKPKSELIADYNGKTIGFCCEGCPEKWADLPEQAKAEKFAAVDSDAQE